MTGNIETLGIPLAFLVGLTILLWFIIGGRGKWYFKVPVIALTAYLAMGLWYSMNGLLGWPTEEDMPSKFRIHWIVVQPPTDEKAENGAVFVWAEDIQPQQEKKNKSWWHKRLMFPFHSKYEENDPRLYKVEYSKPLHKQANTIANMFLKKGRPYFGTMKKGNMQGEGKGEGKGDGGGNGNGMGLRNSLSGARGPNSDIFGRGGGDPQFYQLPPPKFPKKAAVN